jgi:hypothetical protein
LDLLLPLTMLSMLSTLSSATETSSGSTGRLGMQDATSANVASTIAASIGSRDGNRWVRSRFDKNPLTATPVAPVQTHQRSHPRVKSRTHAHTRRVSGGFWVIRGFEQSRGEFDHEAMTD